MSAAAVTSRLFPPGTIYASAMTPVIVAAVSELLNRPASRVSELRRQRRTLVMESRRFEAARVRGEVTHPLAGAPDFARGTAAEEELVVANGSGEAARITIHGRRRGVRRLLHPRVWLATGLIAFAIAVAALTLPELIFGGALTTSHRTTFFGGSTAPSKQTKTTTTTHTTTTGTQTATQTTPTSTSQTPTQTQTTPTSTGTQTAPSGGAPAPSGTGTSTAPAPSGAAVPPSP